MPHEDCVFCQIVAGRASGHVIAEDELAVCLLDINPLAEGHCLVISKRHTTWWHDMTEEETICVFRMARLVANRLKAAFSPEFVCMYARGRRIPHTHVFLVPTSRGDVVDSVLIALERFQESPQALATLKTARGLSETAAKLRISREES